MQIRKTMHSAVCASALPHGSKFPPQLLHFPIIYSPLLPTSFSQDHKSVISSFPFSAQFLVVPPMGATKLLLAIILSLFVSAAIGLTTPELNEAQECRIRRLTASQPSQRIRSEGGEIEFWDQNEEQFQCAGVAAAKFTLRPNTVHLPNFHTTPSLAYVLEGKGLYGGTIPGCAETFSSQEQQQGQEQEKGREQYSKQQADHHQRVLRIRRGDVIAVPSGAAHWWANHDNQENLVVIIVKDLNHLANQLDERLRLFYLAGGLSKEARQQLGERGEGQKQPSIQNVIQKLDPELLAEAFNIPVDIIRKMQKEDVRGLIVNAQQGLSGIIRPRRQQQQGEEGEGQGQEQEEEEAGGQEQEHEQEQGEEEGPSNGLEETGCTMKVRTNIDRSSEADVYSRQAGRVSVADQHKLPFLRYLDMSMEKGELFPNALVSPHWTMNGHCIMYVIRGDAQVEAANYNGQSVMNERVNQGDMVVVPQFFTATIKAGRNGFEWVSVKTTSSPMKNTIAGYTSVFRAQPLEVLTHSYQIPPGDAQKLKFGRGSESLLLSSSSQSQRPYN